MNKKLTYEDFEIGQKVILSGNGEWDEEQYYDIYLTIGNEYEITDLDFHFPDSVCIVKDNGYSGFMKIEHFDDRAVLREQSIDKLLDNQ